jgi:hypothetical protein
MATKDMGGMRGSGAGAKGLGQYGRGGAKPTGRAAAKSVSKGMYKKNVKNAVKTEMRLNGGDALIAKRGANGVRPFSKTSVGSRAAAPVKPSKTTSVKKTAKKK